jgi:hypothetical protein
MNIKSYFKSFSPVEIAVLFVFIVYIVFPIKTPVQFSTYIDSPFGLLTILIITLYLFFYCNPVLGVVYILVAYELLRRSSLNTHRVPIIQYVPSEKKRAEEMAKMNPPNYTTLEEEIVQLRAPIDVSKPILYNETTFKPVAEDVMGASSFL